MLNKKDLEKIKSDINSYEKQRDRVVITSREVVQLSKKVIYSLHRNDLKSAGSAANEMTAKLKSMCEAAKHPKLLTSGSYKVAVQEYVEAIAFFELMSGNPIPPNSKLKLDPEYYLMGLIDLTGEIVRKAINSAIKGDYKTSVRLKDLVSDLHDELLLFDFAGGELRKKFDSVKYDLKKLDDLVLNLKLLNKIE
jgi:predicted translin family RNA/ssDNA-binding protein